MKGAFQKLPHFPPSGPATGSFNVLHPKSNFLAVSLLALVVSVALMVALSVLALTGQAQAALTIVQSNGKTAVFDTLSGKYWYWDLSNYSSLTYDQQISKIKGLSGAFGQKDWHMVDKGEIEGLLASYNYGEIGAAFHYAYTQPAANWTSYSGRIDEATSAGYHTWLVFDYYQPTWDVRYLDIRDSTMGSNVSAWIATPEPSTFVMLGMGAIGLLAFAGRRRAA